MDFFLGLLVTVPPFFLVVFGGLYLEGRWVAARRRAEGTKHALNR